MGEPRSIWKSARDDPRSFQADCSFLLTSIIRFSREGGIVSGAELGLTPSSDALPQLSSSALLLQRHLRQLGSWIINK
jgi:hypothetical protein